MSYNEPIQDPKPTVGRTVLYTTASGIAVPAIITSVLPGVDLVTLQIFYPPWMVEDPANPDPRMIPMLGYAKSYGNPPMPGSWHWPVIEDSSREARR